MSYLDRDMTVKMRLEKDFIKKSNTLVAMETSGTRTFVPPPFNLLSKVCFLQVVCFHNFKLAKRGVIVTFSGCYGNETFVPPFNVSQA